MRKFRKDFYTDDEIKQIILDNTFTKEMNNTLNSDVSIYHLENIFENETYYAAMKIVPLLERKVLYLLYVENATLEDVCKRLKLRKHEAIKLRGKAIKHFKTNLNVLKNAEGFTGGDSIWK